MTINIKNEAIPRLDLYSELLKSQLFRGMEEYSDKFNRQNKELYKKYSQSWVLDPLHQWSRQWEYPFIYQCISEYVDNSDTVNILDAGAGFTFFPHYIAETIPSTKITCVDSDKSLKELYDEVSAKDNNAVEFVVSDLRRIDLEDKKYDVVYCVSVLEHTNDYENIVAELSRVSKDTSLLIVTFDVALSGKSDIPIHKAMSLIDTINNYFPNSNIVSGDLLNIQTQGDIVSTGYFIDKDKSLLPWRFPILNFFSDFFKGKYRKTLYKRLTFVNGQFSR